MPITVSEIKQTIHTKAKCSVGNIWVYENCIIAAIGAVIIMTDAIFCAAVPFFKVNNSIKIKTVTLLLNFLLNFFFIYLLINYFQQ